MFHEYLKINRYVKIITSIFSLFLLLRGIDTLMDYISEILYEDKVELFKTIVDFSLIVFYFLENIPSI